MHDKLMLPVWNFQDEHECIFSQFIHKCPLVETFCINFFTKITYYI